MQVPSLADAHVLVQTGGAKRRRRGGEAEAEAEAAAAVAVVFERAPGGRAPSDQASSERLFSTGDNASGRGKYA